MRKIVFLGLLVLGFWGYADPVEKSTEKKDDVKSVVETTEKSTASKTTKPETGQTYWITSSSGIIHNSSCRYYKNSKGYESKDGKDGVRNCKICGGTGNDSSASKTDTKSNGSSSGSVSSGTGPQGQAIQTGPRGGKYYINKNGNKTYVKRK